MPEGRPNHHRLDWRIDHNRSFRHFVADNEQDKVTREQMADLPAIISLAQLGNIFASFFGTQTVDPELQLAAREFAYEGLAPLIVEQTGLGSSTVALRQQQPIRRYIVRSKS